MNLIIVSGLSGSGKSVALHALEDMGCFCIDNLPVTLLHDFALEVVGSDDRLHDRAAAGIDARNRPRDLARFPQVLEDLRRRGIRCDVLYLEAEDETLIKRFSETRRRHPLSGKEVPLTDAIGRERDLLEPIAAEASVRIDTTRTTMHELRDLIRERVQGGTETLSLLFQSFGYKHGVPSDADFVFDVRCLPNPHWEPQLRGLTGLDRPVIDFLELQPVVEDMYNELCRFLEVWLPRFQHENRSYLTVAVGCTGGQHRSVYLADRLARRFGETYENVATRHRELS